MSTTFPRPALVALQDALIAHIAGLGDEDCRTQFHPALSPPGWHLRHCVFVESLWIRERLLGDERLTAPLAEFCLPERAPKSLRGRELPPHDELLAWSRAVMAENLDLLGDLPPRARGSWLVANGYVWDFLVSHHAQHLETIRMSLAARAMARCRGYRVARPLRKEAPDWQVRSLPAGRYEVGARDGFAYDNEQPRQAVTLDGCVIAAEPVTNAQYLSFMTAGGYDCGDYWTPSGARWRERRRIDHPYGWQRDADGHWYGVGPDGAHDLDPDSAVSGLSRHEAVAFAAWAGGSLPHEYHWEAAAASGLLKGCGQAWEWCANRFHPYPGFRIRPYREYSAPWYDGRHFVLRGASRYSEPSVARASFRNYYLAGVRHHFAGLRLRFGVHEP